MKKIFLILVTITTAFAACTNSSSGKNDNNAVLPVVAIHDTSAIQTPVVVADSNSIVSIKEILDKYLQIKNAFVKDNDKAAAAAANEMAKAFANFNTTALTAAQLKIFADIADDSKEHAEHIGKSAGNIKHQREHFDLLSKDIYQLVKTFGGGQKLYYDHCPMYNDGKGANWLSETKEIANPYFGAAMSGCGVVKEEIK